MEKISLETAAKHWQRINTYGEEEIFRSLKRLHDSQPLIMIYLRVASREVLNEDEHEMLYYLGSFVVEVMLTESPNIVEVTEELWDKVRAINLEMLGFLASEEKPAGFLGSVEDIIDANKQSHLFRFIFELVMKDPQCRRCIREENVWRILTHLKIVIDSLDKAMAGV